MLDSMEKKEIVFVILNYNVYEPVLDCVESIRTHLDTSSYAIVVVDNPSGKDVGTRLAAHYADAEDVAVLCLAENCGFAQGNNAGIAYAREQYTPKFVVCLNNDTLLEQTDFYAGVLRSYADGQPAVIGPKVILRDGSVQQVFGGLQTMEDYEAQLAACRKRLTSLDARPSMVRRTKDFLLQFRAVRFLNGLRHLSQAASFDAHTTEAGKMHRDLVLHGCCLVFTPAFFTALDGFHPGTFMFREEELLFLSLLQKDLHDVYDPRLAIRHLEDVSTDSVCVSSREKQKFLLENQVRSLGVLIDELGKIRKRGG